MRWLDAAEQVLRQAETPLNYNDLTGTILKRNLVETQSKTPAITLHASISIDIKRREERGLPPRFTLAAGDVALAEWDLGPFEEALKTIGKTREKARRDLLAALRKLKGDEFEAFVELLFTEMGYDVTVTGGGGDDGIDLVAELSTGIGAQRIGIQAKCYGANRTVGPNTVRLLRDALSTRQCNAGAVVATCRMDAKAIEVAAEPGKTLVELVDHDRLVDLALEYKVGIRSESLDVYSESLASAFAIGGKAG
ncbi:MAG TPA: restriction endonuclease [Gaiellaceae bacterium]|jgi:restriction endonuclease Mrr|nr:restriction endonuclease [Gaiellaceae bacterium]